MIISVNSVHDVKETMLFARQHNLMVAIQSSGHSYIGRSTCDGGIQVWAGNKEEYIYTTNTPGYSSITLGFLYFIACLDCLRFWYCCFYGRGFWLEIWTNGPKGISSMLLSGYSILTPKPASTVPLISEPSVQTWIHLSAYFWIVCSPVSCILY